MDEVYGLPVVNANDVYGTLAKLGVVPWKKLGEPIPLKEYLTWDLTELELREVKQYALRNEVAFFRKPNGAKYAAMRGRGRSCVTVFSLLPDPRGGEDFVVLSGEWKQGTEETLIHPPAGVPNPKEKKSSDQYKACAERIFLEETGMKLERLVPLYEKLTGINTRNLTTGHFPFLGIPKMPIEHLAVPRTIGAQYVKAVLMPLSEWLKILGRFQVYEEISFGSTLRALLYLGRLKLT